jgi:hypothetical protein
MVAYRAQVIIHTTDAIAENFVTNSLAFYSTVPIADITDLDTPISTFFNYIASYYPAQIAQNGHEIKYYELGTGLVPNYPIATSIFNFSGAPSAAGLPAECAVCISFQAIRASGFPQNRRRGRIYIGPLAASVNSGARPSSALLTDLGIAAADFMADVPAAVSTASWAVWSEVDQEANPVDNGWIDNAFDTQRRRGVQATARTLF